jgi:hypothetical protein
MMIIVYQRKEEVKRLEGLELPFCTWGCDLTGTAFGQLS